jgi:hypothetical protein
MVKVCIHGKSGLFIIGAEHLKSTHNLSQEEGIGDFLMDVVAESIHLFIMQKNPNTTRPKTRREAVD